MLSGKRRDEAGYFSPIMDVLLQVENTYRDSAFGIVAQWTALTGWCDVDSKKKEWRIWRGELPII